MILSGAKLSLLWQSADLWSSQGFKWHVGTESLHLYSNSCKRFIQSVLHCIEGLHLTSSCLPLGNRTNDLGVASAMPYCLSYCFTLFFFSFSGRVLSGGGVASGPAGSGGGHVSCPQRVQPQASRPDPQRPQALSGGRGA